jgi:transcriptional regulator with PAS, ATPase and Fis domain
MRRVVDLIEQVADTDATVLLEGESGTGKGLAAEEIHRRSGRSDGPFLDMNCAGLSPTLLESELFGHEKGAFTDASRTKPGLLEIASGGTVFLDEIGEMPLEVQSKLLKVLESRRFRRVGGIRDVTSNVRLIAASNHDLKALVHESRFREDLFYRLNVFAITIPPLRHRADDILELAHHFLGDLNRSMGTKVNGFAPSTNDILRRYSWPGNVRELRNVVERAVILVREGQIENHHLPQDLLNPTLTNTGGEIKPLSSVEADHIHLTLQSTGGNIKRAADLLGISRTTLYNKIKAHGLKAAD